MGFYHIWKREAFTSSLGKVASSVLESNLGGWRSGYSRKNPEIHVEMISQIGRPSRLVSRPTHWLQRVRSWFGLF